MKNRLCATFSRLFVLTNAVLLLSSISSFTRAAPVVPLNEPQVTERHLAEAKPDPAVAQALGGVVRQGDGAASYLYNYVDLNGDGNDEVLALLTGPATCGTGGCLLVVLQPQEETYNVLSEISLVQGPVLVAQGPKPWRDLILGVGGGGEPSEYRVLAHQASGYPSNPTVGPATTLTEPVEAESYLDAPPQHPTGFPLGSSASRRGVVLAGAPWRWSEITNPVSGTTKIPDPDAYLLTFGPAKLEVVTPCLDTSFPYSLKARTLRVEVGEASCTSDSLSADLLKSLRAARTVSVRDGTLLIDLFADGGTLLFKK